MRNYIQLSKPILSKRKNRNELDAPLGVSQRFLMSGTPAPLSTVSFYPPSPSSKHKLRTMPFTFHCGVIGFVCSFWADNCSLFLLLRGLEIEFSPFPRGNREAGNQQGAATLAAGLELCVCVFRR